MLLLSLFLAGCTARNYNWDDAELEVVLPKNETHHEFQVVLTIREGALPDPDVIQWDSFTFSTDIGGKYDTDVFLDGKARPRASLDYGEVALDDLLRGCEFDASCERVIDIIIDRRRTKRERTFVFARWSMWTTQAAITLFPSVATEQEIRLQILEPGSR